MEKQLRRYILPNILAMVGISCYVLADTFFISLQAGADGITALNLTLPLYALMFALGAMVGIGSATRYSLCKSFAPEEALSYFFNSLFWTLLLSLPFVAAGIFAPDTVLRWMGADDTIVAIGTSYIRIALCYAPFFMLNYTFTAFVRNDNAPNIAMTATLVSGLFNIVFDYIFMFPMGLGMVGAALATGISPIVSMSICMVHYLSKNSSIVFTKKRPSLHKLFASCSLGVVAFVGELSSGITTLVFNFILLSISGNTAVAAYGVIANIALVGTALLNGVSLGLQPVASAMHGRADAKEERRIYAHALIIAEMIAVMAAAAAVLFGDQLIAVFNSERSAELASYAAPGIRVYFAGFLIAAVNIIKSGFYSAIGKAAQSSAIALSRGVITISALAFLLSAMFGVMGVWMAFPASELVTWILSLVMNAVRKTNDTHIKPHAPGKDADRREMI